MFRLVAVVCGCCLLLLWFDACLLSLLFLVVACGFHVLLWFVVVCGFLLLLVVCRGSLSLVVCCVMFVCSLLVCGVGVVAR